VLPVALREQGAGGVEVVLGEGSRDGRAHGRGR
jgi:hypothetical protein